MDTPSLFQKRPLKVYKDGSLQQVNDPVVIENHLNLLVNDMEFATLVSSPAAYQELAIGYLLSEGILSQYEDLLEISCNENERVVKITTAEPLQLQKNANYRQVNSCAGKGQQGLQSNSAGIKTTASNKALFTPTELFAMLGELEKRAGTFRLTGGTHSAGLGCQGELLVSYEDIGRHNAVDKVFGYAFLNQIALEDKCLVLSGRIAAEILLKAARRNIPLVLSRSAATGLAVDLAEEMGITMVGFARGERFNVYSHSERIKV